VPLFINNRLKLEFVTLYLSLLALFGKTMRINILILLVLWGLDFYAQPGGEDCSSATPISSIPFTGIGNTAGALDYHFASCADVSNAGGAPEHVYSSPRAGQLSMLMQVYAKQLQISIHSCIFSKTIAFQLRFGARRMDVNLRHTSPLITPE